MSTESRASTNIRATTKVTTDRDGVEKRTEKHLSLNVNPGLVRTLRRSSKNLSATLSENLTEALHLLVRETSSTLSLANVSRRLTVVRDAMASRLGSRRKAAQTEYVRRKFVEVMAVNSAAAKEPQRTTALLILLANSVANSGPLWTRADRVAARLASRLVANRHDRGLFERLIGGLWAPLETWRIKRFMAVTGLRAHQPSKNATRFLEGADYVGVAEAFTNLLLPYLPNVASSSRNDQSGAAVDALELVIAGFEDPVPAVSHDVAQTVSQVGGGFSPGDERARLRNPRDLAKWYWLRAEVLDCDPSLKIRKLDRFERDVAKLERAEAVESHSWGLDLPRPLRHAAFRIEEDDPVAIDYSNVFVVASGLVEHVTFGVGRVFPAIPVPIARKRTYVREGTAKEMVLIETDFEIGGLHSHGDVRRILFVRDSSGSMGGISLGTRLDCVTLGIFSVLKTLEAKGLANSFTYGAIDFSDTTQFSGFVPWTARRAFDKVVLTDQCGGTSIAYQTLRRALQTKEKTLTFFLTDGALAVSGGTSGQVIDVLKTHPSYVVAADGVVSGFCQEAAGAGIVTLLLDNLEKVGPVFSTIIAGETRVR